MKILFVAMRSIHTTRWISQLQNSGYEVHWFDILNGGYIKELDWVTQHTNWRWRLGNFKGRTFIKKNLPQLHKYLENIVEHKFKAILKDINPDVVHSLALNQSCLPILKIMKVNKNIPWIYSSWGSDLFNKREKNTYETDLKSVLPHISHLITDCHRDYKIAKTFGFDGHFMGVFPGGGGYNLDEIDTLRLPFNDRNLLLVKGYQGKLGRSITVLESILQLKETLSLFKIVVFGADEDAISYIEKSNLQSWNNFEYYKHLSHNELISKMCKAKIYIGNSISDGMPNTLLEAICCGAFPIQSNPGNSTAEIIVNGFNGFLIHEPDQVSNVVKTLQIALKKTDLEKGVAYNIEKLRHNYEYNSLVEKVIKNYKIVKCL